MATEVSPLLEVSAALWGSPVPRPPPAPCSLLRRSPAHGGHSCSPCTLMCEAIPECPSTAETSHSPCSEEAADDGCRAFSKHRKKRSPPPEPRLGGDRDKHGCCPSCGQGWE
eukprot:gene50379-13458_t